MKAILLAVLTVSASLLTAAQISAPQGNLDLNQQHEGASLVDRLLLLR